MDDWGRLDTPIHRVDARAKALVTLVFVVVVMSFPRHEFSALLPLCVYPLTLLSLGRIPLRDIAMKILVAAPFAVMVGIFNPLLDRHPMAVVGPWIISGGWMSFFSILLRFALTVGAALALVACTGMYRLCAGLEQLGFPRVLVAQVLFLYRYLFVVANEGGTMLRSVELRSAGGRRLPRLSTFAPLAGHLLLRSMDRAGRIHRSMVARGFDGEIRVPRRAAFRVTDALFVLGWSAFFAVVRGWNLSEALGRWLMGVWS